tara:strand:+ start:1933 stop:2271 length:339 start_codon:yes stop_codon:yes gene_type:complete
MKLKSVKIYNLRNLSIAALYSYKTMMCLYAPIVGLFFFFIRLVLFFIRLEYFEAIIAFVLLSFVFWLPFYLLSIWRYQKKLNTIEGREYFSQLSIKQQGKHIGEYLEGYLWL